MRDVTDVIKAHRTAAAAPVPGAATPGAPPPARPRVHPGVHLGAGLAARLADPARLAALRATGLLDSDTEVAFDRLTRLATQLLGAPVALLTLVDDHRQFFKSAVGLPPPVAAARQTPLSHSFCQYVVADAAPLLVGDTRAHAVLRANPAVPELGVAAYCGVPLRADGGQVVGALCAIDTRPRTWTAADLRALEDLAAGAMAELELRATARRLDTARGQAVAACAQAEAARAYAEAERATLAAVTASMGDGLLVLDAAGRVRYATPQVAVLCGLTGPLPVGTPLGDAVATLGLRLADREGTRAAWRAAGARLEARPAVEVRLAGPPGRVLQARLFTVPAGTARPGAAATGDAGAAGAGPPGAGLGVLLRDVTAERELQRTKDRFAAMVTHELRTPLTVLVGFTELLLLHEPPPAQRRRYLETMLQEGARLTALTGDYLDLQRLAGGQQALVRTPVALRPLLERGIAAAGDDPARPILLDLATVAGAGAGALPSVLVEGDRILQVLTNLLSNARKYSPGGGAVHVSVRPVPEPSGAPTSGPASGPASGPGAPGAVEITVRDQGLGLPAAALPRLFEPFARVTEAEDPARRGIPGSGLGLAICRQIVEAHGGRIWAHSPGPGGGTTVVFTVPVAPAPAPAGAGEPAVSRR